MGGGDDYANLGPSPEVVEALLSIMTLDGLTLENNSGQTALDIIKKKSPSLAFLFEEYLNKHRRAFVENAIQSGSHDLLQGFDFTRLDLRDLDFSKQNLKNAIFKDVDLTKTNISFEQLRGAKICSGVIVPEEFPLRLQAGECIIL